MGVFMIQMMSNHIMMVYTIKGLTINNWQTDEAIAQMTVPEGTSIQEVIGRVNDAINNHEQLKVYPVLSVNLLVEDNLGNPFSLKLDKTWSQNNAAT